MKRFITGLFVITFLLAFGASAIADGPLASAEGKLFGVKFKTAPNESIVDAYDDAGATASFIDAKWGNIEAKDPGNATAAYDFKTFDSQPFIKSKTTKICVIDLQNKWADGLKRIDPDRYWKLAEDFSSALAKHAASLKITRFYVEIQQENPLSSVGPTETSVQPLKHIYKAVKTASSVNIVIAECSYGSGANSISILYSTGAKSSFDAVAINADASPDKPDVDIFKIVGAHRIMTANGGENKPILLLVKPEVDIAEAYRQVLTDRDIYNSSWVMGIAMKLGDYLPSGIESDFPPFIPASKLEGRMAIDSPAFNYITGKPYTLTLNLTDISSEAMKIGKISISCHSDKDLAIDAKLEGQAPEWVEAGKDASATFKVTFPKEAANKEVTLIARVDYTIKETHYTADCWITNTITPKFELTLLPSRAILNPAEDSAKIGMSVINHSDSSFEGKVKLTAPGIEVKPAEFESKIDSYGLEAYVFAVSAPKNTAPGHYAVYVNVADEVKDWAAVDVPVNMKKAKTPINIDGKLDEWNDAAAVSIAKLIKADTGANPWKVIGKGRFTYDDANFYISFEIDEAANGKPGNITLGFDPLLNGVRDSSGGYKDDDYQYTFNPGDTGKQQSAALYSEGGKSFYEISIPWKDLKSFKPTKDAMFAMSAMIDFPDGPVEWGGGLTRKIDPRKFVPLVLGE